MIQHNISVTIPASNPEGLSDAEKAKVCEYKYV